jgi:nucleoside-diphosphate-sugar epimerase
MPGKVLVTGGSGLLGTATVESFLVAGWSSRDQIETNNAMLRNVVEPIVRHAAGFEHISILQGTKVYGVHLHPIPIPARESDPRDRHANFFHDQEDYLREMGAEHGFTWTALRPQLVTGAIPGALNVLPAIGAYAAIRREKGEPFSFTGGPSFVWEAADAGLVGDVAVWAAESPEAADGAFNITNGDVFEWRNAWPALAKTLGVETGPDEPMSLAGYLADNAGVWDEIVAKYGLRRLSLRELAGHGDQHADFAFAYGAPAGPRAFVSTVKLRQAGFTKAVDTEVAFQQALQSLIDRKFLPPAS